jgi:hypothetical protein
MDLRIKTFSIWTWLLTTSWGFVLQLPIQPRCSKSSATHG